MTNNQQKNKKAITNINTAFPTEAKREMMSYFINGLPSRSNELLDKYLLEFLNTNKKEGYTKEALNTISELMELHGLRNGKWVEGLSTAQNKKQSLLQMRRELIQEHECKTATELMIVDKIVASYWHSMRFEMYVHHVIESWDGDGEGYSFDRLKLEILKELHKGIDIARRDFEINLALLKQMKQPNLKINVKTDNAYIAQNQQVINKNELLDQKTMVPIQSLKPNDFGKKYENLSRKLPKN